MDCDCDWDDAELPECHVHEERKAAKEHRCCECRGVIKKGERYHVHSGIWEGRPERFKRCADCESFCCELGCVPFKGLNESVWQCNEQIQAKWKAILSLRRPDAKP